MFPFCFTSLAEASHVTSELHGPERGGTGNTAKQQHLCHHKERLSIFYLVFEPFVHILCQLF